MISSAGHVGQEQRGQTEHQEESGHVGHSGQERARRHRRVHTEPFQRERDASADGDGEEGTRRSYAGGPGSPALRARARRRPPRPARRLRAARRDRRPPAHQGTGVPRRCPAARRWSTLRVRKTASRKSTPGAPCQRQCHRGAWRGCTRARLRSNGHAGLTWRRERDPSLAHRFRHGAASRDRSQSRAVARPGDVDRLWWSTRRPAADLPPQRPDPTGHRKCKMLATEGRASRAPRSLRRTEPLFEWRLRQRGL